MHDNFDLSIVIVTWNSENEIGECLNSIFENTSDLNYEVVVVDNNSSDRTLDELSRYVESNPGILTVIKNSGNYGYTKACNAGIISSKGNNILLLNPDTKIAGSAIMDLMTKLNSTNKIGAIAPQLLNNDRSIQKSCRTFPDYFDLFCELSLLSSLFPESKSVSRWKMFYFDHDREEFVDQPMAAALMIKSVVLNKVNNFDERYLMFFNDVDLCRKIYDGGNKILFYPRAKIFHTKGVSIFKDRIRMIKIWNTDCLSYFRKYHYNFFLYRWLSASLNLSGYMRIFLYNKNK
ncbi:MAG: glycosyltransferase family 2 protein [Bacteroidota bacterium]|nr:glycosyltransferase family 2 protein [Bacteroidota bacterium]